MPLINNTRIKERQVSKILIKTIGCLMLDSKVTLNKIENKVRAISGQRSKQTITWNAVKEALGKFNFFFFFANLSNSIMPTMGALTN